VKDFNSFQPHKSTAGYPEDERIGGRKGTVEHHSQEFYREGRVFAQRRTTGARKGVLSEDSWGGYPRGDGGKKSDDPMKNGASEDGSTVLRTLMERSGKKRGRRRKTGGYREPLLPSRSLGDPFRNCSLTLLTGGKGMGSILHNKTTRQGGGG